MPRHKVFNKQAKIGIFDKIQGCDTLGEQVLSQMHALRPAWANVITTT